MSGVLILAALPMEVEAFPDFLPVWTTGPGKVNAGFGVMQAVQATNPGLVVVVGTAAGFQLGKGLYRPGWTRQRDASSLDSLVGAPVSPPELLPIPGGDSGLVISTGDTFVTDPAVSGPGLADMETYVYAYCLTSLGVDFRVVKYVTDNGDADAARAWRESVSRASRVLLAEVEAMLS